MRMDLLGLDVQSAQQILAREGICPQITITSAPKRANDVRGTLRVVYASDDGALLTASRFLDPLSDEAGRNGESSGQ